MKSLYLPAFFTLISIVATAQQPTLVKDINNIPADYLEDTQSNRVFYAVDGYVFFPSTPVAVANTEWWVSDGTPEGTHPVDPDDDGQQEVFYAAAMDGSFYYSTRVSNRDRLMKYTPSAGTVEMVKEFDDGLKLEFLRDGDQLVLSVFRDNIGNQIWTSDGTTGGTEQIVLITPGRSVSKSAGDGTYTYFLHGADVWRTDGTFGGTVRVRTGSTSEIYIDLFATGNDLYFMIQGTGFVYTLWKSDGTEDAAENLFTAGSELQRYTMQKLGSKVIFGSNGITYTTDGTVGGTSNLAVTGGPQWATVFNDLYYYIGYNSTEDERFLGITDGTQGGTSIIKTVGTGEIFPTTPLYFLGDKMLLQMEVDGKGSELGISDGTEEGTVLLKDINEGPASSNIRNIMPFGDKALFIADDGIHGRELWVTDGTEEGTMLLRDMAMGTQDGVPPSNQVWGGAGQDQYFFTATDAEGTDIWLTNGTGDNATKVYNPGSSPRYIGTLDDMPYFTADNQVVRINAEAEVETVATLPFGFFGLTLVNETDVLVGDKLFFTGSTIENGRELWVTDGTSGGTKMLKDIYPGGGQSLGLVAFATIENKLIFTANDGTHGNELWVSDGTPEGTTLLFDIVPGALSGGPFRMYSMNNKVYFFIVTGSNGTQLWSTDGTSEGTQVEVNFGFDPAKFAGVPAVIGDKMVFGVYQIGEVSELWVSDGTQDGTMPYMSFEVPATYSQAPSVMTPVGDKVYFFVDDGEHGIEPWVTDGTQAGTKVIDMVDGDGGGAYTNIIGGFRGLFYFTRGNALWRTGGTMSTSGKVIDYSAQFTKGINDKMFFHLDSPDYGWELFVLPFTKFAQDIAFEEITDKNEGGEDFGIVASSSLGLPLTFTASPSDRVSINGTSVEILKPGKVTITASQEGTEGIESAEVSQTICINPEMPVVGIIQLEPEVMVLKSSAEVGNQWYKENDVIAGATDQTLEIRESGYYFASVSIDGCATKQEEGTVASITGLEDKVGLSVFPNPAKDKLFVDWNGSSGNASILDVRGNTIRHHSFAGKTELAVHDLPSGFYLLKLTSADRQVIRKFVKE